MNKTIKWLVLLIIVLLALAWLFGSRPSNSPTPRAPAAPSAYRVRYVVESTSLSQHPIDVTYQNATGGTEQREAKTPWEWSGTFERGDFAYISAQNGDDYGGVVARIYVDGTLWKESESEGAYAIASCSGSVGR